MSFSVKKDTNTYVEIQSSIEQNNSIYNPDCNGVFTFASTDGTFTNTNTFGSKFYNSNNPYDPIYHSTTWSIRLPKKTTSCWVGFTTTKISNILNNLNYTNEISTAPSCPKNLSLGNLVFFNITPNNIPYTANRTLSGTPNSFRLILIDYNNSGVASPIPSTDDNSLNVSKIPVLFPDNRLVEYLPPECYYVSGQTEYYINRFWNGNDYLGNRLGGFMTTNIYLTQKIENNLEVTYLNVDF